MDNVYLDCSGSEPYFYVADAPKHSSHSHRPHVHPDMIEVLKAAGEPMLSSIMDECIFKLREHRKNGVEVVPDKRISAA